MTRLFSRNARFCNLTQYFFLTFLTSLWSSYFFNLTKIRKARFHNLTKYWLYAFLIQLCSYQMLKTIHTLRHIPSHRHHHQKMAHPPSLVLCTTYWPPCYHSFGHMHFHTDISTKRWRAHTTKYNTYLPYTYLQKLLPCKNCSLAKTSSLTQYIIIVRRGVLFQTERATSSSSSVSALRIPPP